MGTWENLAKNTLKREGRGGKKYHVDKTVTRVW
jgi:hypothetical protein